MSCSGNRKCNNSCCKGDVTIYNGCHCKCERVEPKSSCSKGDVTIYDGCNCKCESRIMGPQCVNGYVTTEFKPCCKSDCCTFDSGCHQESLTDHNNQHDDHQKDHHYHGTINLAATQNA